MKWKIWWCGRSAVRDSRWVVIRPDLSIVGYYATFEQARRMFIAAHAVDALTTAVLS